MTTLIRFDGLVAEQLPARAKAWRNMDGEERLKHRAGRVTHALNMKMLLNPRLVFGYDAECYFAVAWRGEVELVSAVNKRIDEWGVFIPTYFIYKATTTENIVDWILSTKEDCGATCYIDSNPEVLRAVKAKAPDLLVIQLRPILAAPIKERKAK